MRVKDAVGRFGEDVAAEHLAASGLTILARNWRCTEGEIDIVAREGTDLVFVEVKTRSSLAFGEPAEAVDRVKAARIRRIATTWMQQHRGVEAFWPAVRFDVVSVLRRRAGGLQVQHLRGAF